MRAWHGSLGGRCLGVTRALWAPGPSERYSLGAWGKALAVEQLELSGDEASDGRTAWSGVSVAGGSGLESSVGTLAGEESGEARRRMVTLSESIESGVTVECSFALGRPPAAPNVAFVRWAGRMAMGARGEDAFSGLGRRRGRVAARGAVRQGRRDDALTAKRAARVSPARVQTWALYSQSHDTNHRTSHNTNFPTYLFAMRQLFEDSPTWVGEGRTGGRKGKEGERGGDLILYRKV